MRPRSHLGTSPFAPNAQLRHSHALSRISPKRVEGGGDLPSWSGVEVAAYEARLCRLRGLMAAKELRP